MALVTLAGTISANDLNTNFSDKLATIAAANVVSATGKDFQYDLEIFDLINTTSVGARTLDFTVPDDLEFRVLGLTIWAAGAGATVTVTLTAIDIDQASASIYMLDEVISLSRGSSAGEGNATRVNRTPSTTTKIFLKKGITYRLQASSSSATNVDRCHIYLLARARRRRT